VRKRAVGNCKWSRNDYQRELDGCTSEAKRFTFIAHADFLNQHGAVTPDWNGPKDDNPALWISVDQRPGAWSPAPGVSVLRGDN
jgi:hypothetical protein